MRKLLCFKNVDVLACLESIMKQNTAFHQDDFCIDREIIRRAANSDNQNDKTLLWFSRQSGTCCVKEYRVFLKNTQENNTWTYYAERESERVLAYAVEITGIENGKIKADLYELDYKQHSKHVIERALPIEANALYHEQDEQAQKPFGMSIDFPDPKIGDCDSFETGQGNQETLRTLLQGEKMRRKMFTVPETSIYPHIVALRLDMIASEAQRIEDAIDTLRKSNRFIKSRFTVELSPKFCRLATPSDANCLASMLPYRAISFAKSEGESGRFTRIETDGVKRKGTELFLSEAGTKKGRLDCLTSGKAKPKKSHNKRSKPPER